MKRIHVKPKPLPRIVRIALCVLAAAVLLFAVYAVSGYPAFSPEQALRRAERRALISMRGEVLASEPQMLYNGNATRLQNTATSRPVFTAFRKTARCGWAGAREAAAAIPCTYSPSPPMV